MTTLKNGRQQKLKAKCENQTMPVRLMASIDYFYGLFINY